MRVLAEMFTEMVEGEVVDGGLMNNGSGNFDLDCQFVGLCDYGARFRVPGWAAEITGLEAS